MGHHHYCGDWLWEVTNLLDGSSIIKHGIVVLVTPLKLLGVQFVGVLERNELTAVSMTASNSSNELFEVRDLYMT